MAYVKIPYHKEYKEVNLPDTDNINIIKPRNLKKVENEKEAIISAIDNPIGKPTLPELINKNSSVSILVDDITRPTPTKKLLGPLLKILGEMGIKKKNIKIIFALGTHRSLSKEEQKRLLGSKILNEYEVLQHNPQEDLTKIEDPIDKEKTIDVNRWVAEADLRVLTGLIKPHAFAGYTGGAKSILPGVSGLETIKGNHSYAFLSHPLSSIGVIEGNPAREDMERKAHLLEPNFIINVILNNRNEIVAVVAGDMIKAHRKGVKTLDKMVKVKVNSPADVVLAACPFPTDLNLYQASFGTTVAKSIVKKGGVIILVAHCGEGLGEGEFVNLITKYPDPEELLGILSDPSFFKCGQWGAQTWAEILQAAHVIIVSNGGIPENYYENSSVERAASIEEAWEKAKKILNKRKLDAYILPEAPFTIPFLNSHSSS